MVNAFHRRTVESLYVGRVRSARAPHRAADMQLLSARVSQMGLLAKLPVCDHNCQQLFDRRSAVLVVSRTVYVSPAVPNVLAVEIPACTRSECVHPAGFGCHSVRSGVQRRYCTANNAFAVPTSEPDNVPCASSPAWLLDLVDFPVLHIHFRFDFRTG